MAQWEETVKRTARRLLTDNTHDYGHTLRVCELAEEIARSEDADVEIVRASALLHDVGYAIDEEKHDEKSAEIASALLEMTDFPKEKIPNVIECILSHRYSKGKHAVSIEAKILQDADRLDAIGALGVARCFLWTGKRGGNLSIGIAHFYDKLLKLKDGMNTKAGKKIAEKRHKVMEDFIKQLEEEYGKRLGE
ncbi:MAG: HD domain-containing protein [Candidatus Micrarchaeia archaeon]